MKKIFIYIVAAFLLVCLIVIFLLTTSATSFEVNRKYLYVTDGSTAREQILHQLDTGRFVKYNTLFRLMADNAGAWEKVTAGRFEIEKDASIIDIVRTLRNNKQSPVNFVINKVRTKENFAKLIERNFSIDSITAIQFLTNNDSLLQFGVDTNTVFTLIIPNTYQLKWNNTMQALLSRLKNESEKFWAENNRETKASGQGLTPQQAYIIASIVEEETNKNDEKGDIASVYMNRMNKGMPLGADPTIKYALRDFSIKRILYGHLQVKSSYNTYQNKGLPPGPICTPSIQTIDAVLNAPKTDYLFFVAKSDFSGYHHFSNNFAEHQQYARLYQQALDQLIKAKQKETP